MHILFVKRNSLFLLFILIVAVAICSAASAQTTLTTPADSSRVVQEEAPLSPLDQGKMQPILFRAVFSLFLIIGLICLGSWGLKKMLQKQRVGKGIPIRVVGSSFLGQKKSIYLVDVEDKRLVLGVTDASISFLTELEKKPDSDELIKNDGSGTGPSGFRDLLDTLLKKRGGNE